MYCALHADILCILLVKILIKNINKISTKVGLRLVKAHYFCLNKFTKFRANPTEEAAMEADVLFVSAASVLLFLIIFLSTNLIRRGPLTSFINIQIEHEYR